MTQHLERAEPTDLDARERGGGRGSGAVGSVARRWLSSGLVRRLAFGLGANAFGQVVSIVIQLFSLPFFLLFWDAPTFGTWILLSTLPAYLSMADIGMVSVAGNRMTMALGRGDIRDANVIYQSALLFMTVVCGGLAVITTPLALLWPAQGLLTPDMRVALAALLWLVLVSLWSGVSEAVFRATGRFAVGTTLGHLARLMEWVGFMVGLVAFRDFAGVAVCGLLARSLSTGAVTYLAQRDGRGLVLGFRHASARELRDMIGPAVSFMAFPLANALSFQGVTLLVGTLAGTSAVALFTAYRTVARVAVQLTSTISLALWPEFSRLFGQAGMGSVHALFRRSALVAAAGSMVFSAVLYLASPWLLAIWTHGRIAFVPSLMAWLLAYAAVGGIWHVPRVLLMATNQHIGLSGWSLGAGVLCVALSWGLGQVWNLNGVGAAMLFSESLIAGICVFLTRRLFAHAQEPAGAALFGRSLTR